MADRSRSGSRSYHNFDRSFFGSIIDRKLLKMICLACQNKLKLFSSTDFTPLG
jgi:hypothetical protein